MNVEQVELFIRFLKRFSRKLNSKWVFVVNHDSAKTLESMGSDIEADFLLIDIDDEIGKRVWYFLSAFKDENKMIAFTSEPWTTDAKYLIKKPLFDYAKNEESVDPNKIVTLLNRIEKTSA
ncbi:MAG: hypothetical protein IPN42_05070 [Methylococcaceae bacterium]|nr:hypothetical protein [Methylococcaceae bacterium]